MADTRNLGTGSGGVGTARFAGGISGSRTTGGGAFAANLPDLNLPHSVLTTREVDCTSGDNAVYLHDKTAVVAIIAPPNNTVAIAVSEYSATKDAGTQIELNPNGFACWTPKAGTTRRLTITTDGSVTLSVHEA